MKYYFVYALKSQKDGQFYFGFTEDVHQRLTEHNAGNNVSTKDRRPLDLVFLKPILLKQTH